MDEHESGRARRQPAHGARAPSGRPPWCRCRAHGRGSYPKSRSCGTDTRSQVTKAGPARPRGPAEPIPLTVLTGFLGAGKTSLLNRLMHDPRARRDRRDHQRVRRDRARSSAGQADPRQCRAAAERLPVLHAARRSGRGAGAAAARPRQRPHRVPPRDPGDHRARRSGAGAADRDGASLSGPALPARRRDHRGGCGERGRDARPAHGIGQAGRGRRPDRADQDRSARPRRRAKRSCGKCGRGCAALNPAATILDAAAGEATAQSLLGCGLFDPDRKIPDVKRWLAEEAYAAGTRHGSTIAHHHDPNRHDERIRAFTLATDAPIPAASFEMFIDLLRSLHGPKLLRLKGIVKIAEEPARPLVIHGVQHVMHPAVRLEGWPDADERTRIVLITRDLERRRGQPPVRRLSQPQRPRPARPRRAPRQSAGPVRGPRSLRLP